MIDIVFHKNKNYVLPDEITTDPNVILANKYITLIQTLLGSVESNSSIGVKLPIGKLNMATARLHIDRAHNDIINQVDSIKTITIKNYRALGDTVSFTANINNVISLGVVV